MGQRGGRAGQVDGGAKRDSKFGIRRERNLVRERVELLTEKGMQGKVSAAALSALWLLGGVKLPHSQPPGASQLPKGEEGVQSRTSVMFLQRRRGWAKVVEGVAMCCCSHSVQKISTEAGFAKSSKNVTSTH